MYPNGTVLGQQELNLRGDFALSVESVLTGAMVHRLRERRATLIQSHACNITSGHKARCVDQIAVLLVLHCRTR
jgi:hypothetical protein